MARLRSARIVPLTFNEGERDEHPEARVDAEEEVLNSRRTAEEEERSEAENSDRLDEFRTTDTNTHITGLFKRTIGYFLPGTPRTNHSNSLNKTSTIVVENASERLVPLSTAVVTGRDGGNESVKIGEEGPIRLPTVPNREDLVEIHGRELIQLPTVSTEEEQPAKASIATADEEQQQGPEVVTSIPELLLRPTRETADLEEVPHPSDPKLGKTRKHKPRVYNDNSFQYSKPKKDVYEFPSHSPEKEILPKPASAAKKKNTKATTKNVAKKSTRATKSDDKVLGVKDTVPPKRRGRPPKDALQKKTDNISIGAKLPVHNPKEGFSKRSEVSGILDESLGARVQEPKVQRGKPKTAFQDQSERTTEPELVELLDEGEHDQPVTNTTKTSKKRTNDRLQGSSKASKKAKTTHSAFEPDEDNNDDSDDDKSSSRSQSRAPPKKRSLMLEVATAEELVRQRRKEVKIKKRELKIAERLAEDAELVAERWRGRLDRAREHAIALEREEKGLPPLEPRRHIIDLSGEEEDFKNGVERVGGRERYHKIWTLPIFKKNNRSYDDVFTKIVDFKHDMVFDWERKRLEDPGVKPLENWIMSIPDK